MKKVGREGNLLKSNNFHRKINRLYVMSYVEVLTLHFNMKLSGGKKKLNNTGSTGSFSKAYLCLILKNIHQRLDCNPKFGKSTLHMTSSCSPANTNAKIDLKLNRCQLSCFFSPLQIFNVQLYTWVK